MWKLIGGVEERIQNQDTPEEFRFKPEHQVFESIINNINERAQDAQTDKPVLFDKYQLSFENAMDMSDAATNTEVVDVELKPEDIDATVGEKMPPGNSMKVLQFILKEKKPGNETGNITITERVAGTYKFDVDESHCCVFVRVLFHFLFLIFPPTIFYITVLIVHFYYRYYRYVTRSRWII